MNVNFVDDILNKICIDERIIDGIFSLDNDFHLDILEEYLVKGGISTNNATIVRNKVVEGKYPERQAYNKDGLLVTFPTPEYKQKAIARGTHFEENPKKGQTNVFQAEPATQADPSAPQAAPPAPEQPQQNIFQPETPSTPPTPIQPAAQPATDQKDLAISTVPEKDARTPDEKIIDAKAIQQILSAAPASIDISMKYPNLEHVMKTIQEAIKNNEISSVTLHF
jgi:hypothetical protein